MKGIRETGRGRWLALPVLLLMPMIVEAADEAGGGVHPFFEVPVAEVSPEEGGRPLFNGVDLGDWVNVNGAPETWSVREGVIYCTGEPIAALRTRRQYENFVLELEWRHLREGGNAGVFLWAGPIPAPGQPFLRAIEAQVLDHGYAKGQARTSFTTHGDVFAIHGSKMAPHGRSRGQRSFPSEERSKGSPEWNHYRVVGYNGVLRLSVNGKEVSGGSECDFRKGYIGLESEGSPVEFRNVSIIELPSTGVTAEMTAPEDAGWVHLYNGVDWRGWTREGGGEVGASAWKSRGWLMGHEGTGDGAGEVIWSRVRAGERFEWMVDLQVPKKGEAGAVLGGLCFFGNPEAVVLLGGGEAPVVLGEAEGLSAGTWVRVHCVVEGDELAVHIEGREEAGYRTTLPAVGGLPLVGLQGGVEPVEWANPYLRSLP